MRFQRLDETLEAHGLRLEGLAPGGYAVAVELGGGAWTNRPVLAREEIDLAAFETGELVLVLADPPAPPARASLGGMVSFPTFGGEEEVRLKLYEVGSDLHWAAAELSLADLERVGGALPTWSFRVEDLQVGLYQVKLEPFLKSWMIELPTGGLEDVELVIPELAEVVVETVDARTGERIPAKDLKYGSRNVLPGQVNDRFGWADLEQPGRFRFWTAPGAAYVQTNRIVGDYGWRREDLELVPGLQSVRLEVGPAYLIRFEFRVDGAALRGPEGLREWVRYGASQAVRAVGHEGRALGAVAEQVVEVTAPGVYEVSFEGVGGDRFHPIPPRLVDVREGETAEVIVELRRR